MWSRDLAAPAGGPPAWLWEAAEQVILNGEPLPTGVIVGSAVIDRVTAGDGGGFHWHLAGVERTAVLRKPERQPFAREIVRGGDGVHISVCSCLLHALKIEFYFPQEPSRDLDHHHYFRRGLEQRLLRLLQVLVVSQRQ